MALRIEYFNICEACNRVEGWVRELAAELGDRVDLTVYNIKEDPVGTAKYGPVECRTVVLDGRLKLESPTKSELRTSVLQMVEERA